LQRKKSSTLPWTEVTLANRLSLISNFAVVAMGLQIEEKRYPPLPILSSHSYQLLTSRKEVDDAKRTAGKNEGLPEPSQTALERPFLLLTPSAAIRRDPPRPSSLLSLSWSSIVEILLFLLYDHLLGTARDIPAGEWRNGKRRLRRYEMVVVGGGVCMCARVCCVWGKGALGGNKGQEKKLDREIKHDGDIRYSKQEGENETSSRVPLLPLNATPSSTF
jgi:hypothetical protein